MLALDIGSRRTGVAFCSDQTGVAVSLETLQHSSIDDLSEQVLALCSARDVSMVICGLPLLPGGEEGSQAAYVRLFTDILEDSGLAVDYLDERYTSNAHRSVDKDASAACKLILTYQERNS
ncbi:MAG: Holliday junction resolvase RuvX [bacterium]|nr:Holliday junction resolvase RuvX [bacterium]